MRTGLLSLGCPALACLLPASSRFCLFCLPSGFVDFLERIKHGSLRTKKKTTHLQKFAIFATFYFISLSLSLSLIFIYAYLLPTWKNIYVTYMSKCMRYIFAKSCIIRIYFAYIFYIKVPGGNISQNFSGIIFDFLIFKFSETFWEIFSDFFRKFSIVSENYRMKNLIFKEKWRNFRFLTNFKKSLPFSSDISYFLQTRWNWETKNSRKIAETLDLKNSGKNPIFSGKNFYFIRIQ